MSSEESKLDPDLLKWLEERDLAGEAQLLKGEGINTLQELGEVAQDTPFSEFWKDVYGAYDPSNDVYNRWKALWQAGRSEPAEKEVVDEGQQQEELKYQKQDGKKHEIPVAADEKDTSFLDCEVCFEPFGDTEDMKPRLLLCGHTFCTKCLDVLIEPKKNDVKCPTCRQLTPAFRGVTDLKLNFTLIELLNTLASKKPAETCEQCNSKVSTLWCQACECNYCVHCSEEIHSMRALRKHKPVSIENRENAECSEHRTEKISIYCQTCETLICFICRDQQLGTHGTHKVQLIDKAEAEQRKKLQALLDETLSLSKNIGDLNSQVGTSVTQLEAKRDEAISHISNTFSSLATALEARRLELIRRVESDASTGVTKLQNHRSNLFSLVSDTRTLSENMKLASNASGLAVISSYKDLLIKYDELSNEIQNNDQKCDVSSCVTTDLNTEKMLRDIKSFGHVEINLPEMLPNLKSASIRDGPRSKMIASILKKRDVKGKKKPRKPRAVRY